VSKRILKAGLEFKEESESDSLYRDQSDNVLNAYEGGTQVGYVSYSVYQGEVFIKLLKVFDQFKRKGYGTALMKKLQSLYPGVEINLGMLSPEGAKLIPTLETELHPSEYAEDFKELARLKEEEAILQAEVDAFFGTEHTPEERQKFDKRMTRFNEVTDRVWELENDLWKHKPTKTLFKIGGAPFSFDVSERRMLKVSKILTGSEDPTVLTDEGQLQQYLKSHFGSKGCKDHKGSGPMAWGGSLRSLLSCFSNIGWTHFKIETPHVSVFRQGLGGWEKALLVGGRSEGKQVWYLQGKSQPIQSLPKGAADIASSVWMR
jgi:hypothetical protein